jgi:hypothetical protein
MLQGNKSWIIKTLMGLNPTLVRVKGGCRRVVESFQTKGYVQKWKFDHTTKKGTSCQRIQQAT